MVPSIQVLCAVQVQFSPSMVLRNPRNPPIRVLEMPPRYLEGKGGGVYELLRAI